MTDVERLELCKEIIYGHGQGAITVHFDDPVSYPRVKNRWVVTSEHSTYPKAYKTREEALAAVDVILKKKVPK